MLPGSFKLKSVLQTTGTAEDPTYELKDFIEVKQRAVGADMLFKLDGRGLTNTIDIGERSVHRALVANPYISIQTDRKFSEFVLGVGSILRWPNFKLNLLALYNKPTLHLNTRAEFKRGRVNGGLLYGWDITNKTPLVAKAVVALTQLKDGKLNEISLDT